MQYDIQQINHLIRHRRSVFFPQFSEQKIPHEIIQQMLENASWAPTHGKTEPWCFVVFSGEGLKRLGEYQANFYKENTPEEKYDENKYLKLLENPRKASHAIAIGMKRQLSGKIPEIEEVAAVACAVQNMYLTATAYGLGGFWSTGGVTYEESAKSFFGLEPQDKLMGIFYVGYVAKPSPDGVRISITEKTAWVES